VVPTGSCSALNRPELVDLIRRVGSYAALAACSRRPVAYLGHGVPKYCRGVVLAASPGWASGGDAGVPASRLRYRLCYLRIIGYAMYQYADPFDLSSARRATDELTDGMPTSKAHRDA
jgi:hypothetical protein